MVHAIPQVLHLGVVICVTSFLAGWSYCHSPVSTRKVRNMPIYEYHCKECDLTFEEFVLHMDNHKKKCPVCKKKVEKIMSQNTFVLKGSGWYVTDYKNK